jgi:hypothetical protein
MLGLCIKRCGSFQKFCTLYVFSLKTNLFYKIHLQAFNVISVVLYHSGPTFGQVLYSCLDAFIVDAYHYSGHLIRRLLDASEAFPMEWFLQFWEQVKVWWAQPTRLWLVCSVQNFWNDPRSWSHCSNSSFTDDPKIRCYITSTADVTLLNTLCFKECIQQCTLYTNTWPVYWNSSTYFSLFQHLYHASFIFFYNDQQMHNYFTNYHTATCLDTIVSSSDSL